MRIYKNPAMKERAGELRGHMTPQETLLWNYCLKPFLCRSTANML